MIPRPTVLRAAWADSLLSSDWLSRKEAALFLQYIGLPIEPKTLANLASNNNALHGPPFTRFSWKAVRYRVEDLRSWAEAKQSRVP